MHKILGIIILVGVMGFPMYEVAKLEGWISTLKELGIILLYMSFVLLGLYLIFK